MRPQRKVFLAAIVLVQAWVAVPSVTAFQRFTDEAGVVIYTIDDDGIVSMFESRPGTDITLSVTRGTREKMQPRIIEVSPDTIPAGTSTVLKLRGENLVGATVKFNVPGIDVKPYAGKAKSVEIPLTISGSVPPGEIVMEVMTLIGNWEWTGTEVVKDAPGDAADYGATGILTVIVLGQSDCKTERYYETWKTESMEGRCCK